MSVHVSSQNRPAAGISPHVAPETLKEMVWIPGGTFLMGSDDHYPEEAPAHPVTVSGFWIDRTQVTNAAFRRFVKATGYVTLAERTPNAALYPGAKPEMLVAGSVVFRQPPGRVPLGSHYAWWDWLPGADWRHPDGPGSTLHGRERHPVLHVAWEDVAAYAAWAGKEIPPRRSGSTPPGRARRLAVCLGAGAGAEGEDAGQLLARRVPLAEPRPRWLRTHRPGGQLPAQRLRTARYDRQCLGVDGRLGPPRGMRRAVPAVAPPSIRAAAARRRASMRARAGAAIPRKVLKGGSWACAENYCQRYRPAARMPHPVDTGTNHISFRCVVRGDG